MEWGQAIRSEPKKRRGSIIIQVTIVMGVCILMTGVLMLITQSRFSEKMVSIDSLDNAYDNARAVAGTLREYKNHPWLLQYWYEHADEMDIEYDVNFYSGTETRKKVKLLRKHAPDLEIQYANRREVEALSPEDQKLYAEICYSWILTRLNEIFKNAEASYLFVVVSDRPFDRQFFLMSASDGSVDRGTQYMDVYTLGVEASVDESQQQVMKNALNHEYDRADSGDYFDYYLYFDRIEDHRIFIGVTQYKAKLKMDELANTERGSLYAMGYVLFLSVIIMISIFFIVLKPLKTVGENIRLYRDEKESDAVEANLKEIRNEMNNEIGELAADVTDLAKEMDHYVDRISRITAEKERIGIELSLASQIQYSMLPHDFPAFPEREEFDIYASMEPAREVGGDFYDFFMIDDDHLGIVMADVSGKGIPAALFMMVSKSIIKSYAMSGLSVSETLQSANDTICANNIVDMFVTVWMGILELSTGKLRAANAGHEYPVVKAPDGGFELYKDKHGFVIGGMEGRKYKEYELQMDPGSMLFLYTDGIPEATDADNEMFGNERMVDALNIDPEADPVTILENVRESVAAFVKDAEQFDDMTMLCLEYRQHGKKQA